MASQSNGKSQTERRRRGKLGLLDRANKVSLIGANALVIVEIYKSQSPDTHQDIESYMKFGIEMLLEQYCKGGNLITLFNHRVSLFPGSNLFKR